MLKNKRHFCCVDQLLTGIVFHRYAFRPHFYRDV